MEVINFVSWITVVVSYVQANQIPDVLSEIACSEQSEAPSTIISYLIPKDQRGHLLYVKCSKRKELLEKETWDPIYVYDFSIGRLLFSNSTQYSHTWDQNRGRFHFKVNNQENRWFRCSFGMRGKHRHLRYQGYRPGNLMDVIGRSRCHLNNDNIQMIWKTVPSSAKLFHVKCYMTMDPLRDKGQLLFTYSFQDCKLLFEANTTVTHGSTLNWSPSVGELALNIARSKYTGTWCYCDFNGKGRNPHLRVFIRQKHVAGSEDKEVLSTRNPQDTKDSATWSERREHVDDMVDKATSEETSTGGAPSIHCNGAVRFLFLCVASYIALERLY